MDDEWGKCPVCGQPRKRGARFAWCGAAALWIHEECALEHRRQLLAADPDVGLVRCGGQLCCCSYHEDEHPVPSREHGHAGWIQVEGETWPQRTSWTGKWLLYLPPREVDQQWDWVRWGTLGGDRALGYSAKVADYTNLSPRDGTHTCCVYTVDCRDIDDVRRVLMNLRHLGFTRKLFYKDDAATDRFVYGGTGVLYVSPAETNHIIARRAPIQPADA